MSSRTIQHVTSSLDAGRSTPASTPGAEQGATTPELTPGERRLPLASSDGAGGRSDPPPAAELTADEARRLALRAQGYLGAPDRRGGVTSLLRSLGAVQLDTIAVLARSHELVAYSRLGPIGRQAVESAYWGAERPGRTFEFWAHAACILPMEEWPWFAFRRRHHQRNGWRWGEIRGIPQSTIDMILGRLRDEGPLTATDLGGAKRAGPWWDWSDIKIAVEYLLDVGEVVCVERVGWRRVYDLPERAVPSHLRDLDPTDQECLTRLVALAGKALGVATIADIADYYRLTQRQVESVIRDSGLLPVTVAGWSANGNESDAAPPKRRAARARASTAVTAWADPDALATPPRGRHRTTLLSPFDSLVWERRRTRRIFGLNHSLEAYKPAHKREYGYYAMPVLAGGRLIGRVDPKRDGRTLIARQVSLDVKDAPHRAASASAAGVVSSVAEALAEAASWVACESVTLQRVSPDWLHEPLRAAIAARIS